MTGEQTELFPEIEYDPFFGSPEHEHEEIALREISKSSMTNDQIIDLCLTASGRTLDAWTDFGDVLNEDLSEFLESQAGPVFGIFFDKFFRITLENKFPGTWFGERTTSDKDANCVFNISDSFELKTTPGDKIVTNAASMEKGGREKKLKCGHYVIVQYGKDRNVTAIFRAYLNREDWGTAKENQRALSFKYAKSPKTIQIWGSPVKEDTLPLLFMN